MNIQDVIFESTQDSIESIVRFWPNIAGAVGLLIIGWIVSYIVYLSIVKSSKRLKLGIITKKIGLKEFLLKLGIKSNVSQIIAKALRGYIFFMFLIGAVKILKLQQVADFLDTIIKYIPNVVVALLYVLIGIQVSRTVSLFVKGALHFLDESSAEIMSIFTRFTLIFFSVLAALVQLNIADTLVTILFIGFISMLSLAGGLAFGLGGKDLVRQMLEQAIHTQEKKKTIRSRRRS